MVGGGIWCPEPSLLKALRKDVYDNIDEFTGILRDAKFQKYYVLEGEKLKKVPAPFPADFPEGDLLKYKILHGVELCSRFVFREGGRGRAVCGTTFIDAAF